MFWQASLVVPTRFFPWNGHSSQGYSRGSEGSSAIPISNSLPLGRIPSFRFTSRQFRIRWHGSRTRSSIRGTISQPMSSLRLLCSSRSCRECIFRQGSHWFWWCRCGHRKSGLQIFCPCWSMNHSNFSRCVTCWSNHACGSSVKVYELSSFTHGSIQCLRRSTAVLYQSEWSWFLGWCGRRGVEPCKASISQVAEFFLYLHQELGLSVPVVEGYRAALNHVFSLARMDLAASS